MKKTVFIIIALCLNCSCKKVCVENSKFILEGKIKTLLQFDEDSSSGIVSRYNFYYDTISGYLKTVEIQYRYLGEYYTINVITINHLDNNTLLYDNFENSRHKEKYKIILNGKQITAILAIDTLTNEEALVTSIHFNNGILDSIIDVGSFYVLASDIKYVNFEFNNNNCTKFTSYWSDYISGTVNNNEEACIITYNSFKNTNMLQFQTIGEYNASVMSFVGYLLGIDGYYIQKQNLNLIDSINRTYPNPYTVKYDYTFSQDNISRVQISYPPNSSTYNRYNDMTYY
jgi:hypothetical protein